MSVRQVAAVAVAFVLLRVWHVSAAACANVPRTSTAVDFAKLSFDYLVVGRWEHIMDVTTTKEN